MLVHYNVRNGVLYLGRWRIYGISTGHPPTDIPWKIFRDHCKRDRVCRQKGDILVQATYRAADLQKMFGRPFSMVAFTYDELDRKANKTLNLLAKEMQIEPKHPLNIEENPEDRKHLLELIKRKLREVSPDA